jgi:sec-independent protein translocase protein TatC
MAEPNEPQRSEPPVAEPDTRAAKSVNGKGNGKGKPSDPVEEESDDGSMTLWEHLEELRGRIVRMAIAFLIGAIACWIYKEAIFSWLTEPFVNAWKASVLTQTGKEPTITFGSPAALFISYVRLSALSGFVFALPFILYQVWAFVAPGLYSREKRFALPFVFSSCGLFALGGYFGWAVAFPAAFQFLLGMAKPLDHLKIEPTIMVGEYIEFVTRMFLAFGAAAELPVLSFFLTVAGVVTHRELIKFFRYFIVVAFIIAAIVTPPDPLSQILLAVPLIGLYGIGIAVSWVFTRSRERAEKSEKVDDAAKKT